jgi:hypothetical protein
VTYRDDTDAAVARADALEVELKRAEAERDRLREQLAATPASTEMSKREVDALVEHLDSSLAISSPVPGIAMLVLSVPVFLLPGGVSLSVMLVVLGAIALVASLLEKPGDARSVIAAVRDAPDQVVSVREVSRRRSSWSNRRSVFVHTATCRARFRTSSPDTLLVALAKRCPRARLR